MARSRHARPPFVGVYAIASISAGESKGRSQTSRLLDFDLGTSKCASCGRASNQSFVLPRSGHSDDNGGHPRRIVVHKDDFSSLPWWLESGCLSPFYVLAASRSKQALTGDSFQRVSRHQFGTHEHRSGKSGEFSRCWIDAGVEDVVCASGAPGGSLEKRRAPKHHTTATSSTPNRSNDASSGRDGLVCIDSRLRSSTRSLSPCVVKENGIYTMWYLPPRARVTGSVMPNRATVFSGYER